MVRSFCKATIQIIFYLPKKIGLGLIAVYQYIISPYLPASCCRFQLSCSEYVKLEIIKHGLISGIIKGIIRLFQCQPWVVWSRKNFN